MCQSEYSDDVQKERENREGQEVWQVGAEADPESDSLRNTLERLPVELPR